MSRQDPAVDATRADVFRRPRDRGRAICFVGLLASIAFAVYISWVPFNFAAVAGVTLADSLRTAVALSVTSRTNFLANILLFVPYGVFGASAYLFDSRSAWSRWLRAGGLLVCALVLSATIEGMQIFLPGRTPAASDVLAQMAGTILGLTLGAVVGSDLLAWLRRGHGAGREGPLVLLLQIGVAVVIAGMLLPLDVSMSLSSLAQKYAEGRIVVFPFQHQTLATGLVQDLVSDVVLAVPFGALAVLGWATPGQRRSVLTAALASILVLAAVEACQVVVMSRVADVTDVLTGGAGASLGVWIAARLSKSKTVRPVARRSLMAPAGLAVSVLLYALSNWSPFDFSLTKALLEERWPELMQVPFYTYYLHTELQAIGDFAAKFGLSLPLGLFTQMVLSQTPLEFKRLLYAAACIAFLCFFFTIEVGQIFLPSRFPDVTDVVIAMLGFGAGLTLPSMLGRRTQPSHGVAERTGASFTTRVDATLRGER